MYKAKRVLDLGCGEGQLLEVLLHDNYFEDIVGYDVSIQALERAHTKLRLKTLPVLMRQRIKLIQTALTYKDKRLLGYDAAAIVEVIEHLDLPKLCTFRRVVFEFMCPNIIIITTLNIMHSSPTYQQVIYGIMIIALSGRVRNLPSGHKQQPEILGIT